MGVGNATFQASLNRICQGPKMTSLISQLSFERFVQNGGEEGVQLGGGLGLQALQRVHLRLQCVQLGYDSALIQDRFHVLQTHSLRSRK